MSQSLNFSQQSRFTILNPLTFGTPYISEEGAAKLVQYKYAGGDTSIMYKFFYNPVANKLV